jgi:hypothetical protein
MTIGELKERIRLMPDYKDIMLPDGSIVDNVVDTLNVVQVTGKPEKTSGIEYRVNIHERLTRSVVVVAESEEDALEEVKNSYEAGEIAITSDDYMETKFDVEEN